MAVGVGLTVVPRALASNSFPRYQVYPSCWARLTALRKLHLWPSVGRGAMRFRSTIRDQMKFMGMCYSRDIHGNVTTLAFYV